jgi:hypothetical protein
VLTPADSIWAISLRPSSTLLASMASIGTSGVVFVDASESATNGNALRNGKMNLSTSASPELSCSPRSKRYPSSAPTLCPFRIPSRVASASRTRSDDRLTASVPGLAVPAFAR